MKIEKFVIGIISTNCYLLINEDTKETVVIDPGACPGYLVSHIKNEGLQIQGILLTHGHFDHILGLHDFLQEFAVSVYAHEAESGLLSDCRVNGSKAYTGGYEFTDAVYLQDGQHLSLAGFDFQVIHTPGHTCGCVCYYVAADQVLFSGDTLFLGSVGRTDLATGSTEDIIHSVREKLLALAEETLVYPGHMAETTIGYEKKHNPYA